MFNKKCLLFICWLIIGAYSKAAKIPYEIEEFKIPQAVWKQALRPTPVLKSPLTVVVPINVQNEDGYDEDDVEETQNVEVDATMVSEDVIPEIGPAASPTITSAPVADVIDSGIEEAPQVPGQAVKFPCTCNGGQCGCCTGAVMERFRMKACGNMTFIPEDFVFDVRLTMNNNTVVRQRVSASDPPPICFNPRRAPFVRVCAEISNISVKNKNAHACLDLNADIGGFPVYSASFKCFSVGQAGIKTGLKPKKPVSQGPKPVNLFGNGDSEGGFVQNAAETVLDQGSNLFGGEDGVFGGNNEGIFGGDDNGPFDEIGDAFGEFLDGRRFVRRGNNL